MHPERMVAMACEELSLNGFIQEMKDVTTGSHPRRFCFVLGAGASRSSGIKSGQELVRVWDKELRERNEIEYWRWRKELDITDENMSNFYSYYYEKRFNRCPEDGLSFIEGIMENAKPSAGYVMLAYILARTPHNVVITTNFDHLTEDAVTYYAQKIPLVVGHEALSRYIMGIQNRPTIIKIHRDLLFDPKSRTEDIEVLHKNWQDALDRIFENYHPVFIGYAGNDKSLMDYLWDYRENFATNKWKFPYWMLYKTDILEGKTKEILDYCSGYFVKHNGFDDVMIQLSSKFDHSIPKREEFLLEAEQRYVKIEEAIADFSDRTNRASIVKSVSVNSEDINDSETITIEQGNNKDTNDALASITSGSASQNKYHESSILIREEKYSDAIKLLTELIAEDSDNPRYHYKLGEAYYGLGELEKALQEEQEAIRINPDMSVAYITLGQVYEQQGNMESAQLMFSKAAELDPENGLAWYYLGETQETLEQYEDALVSFQAAAEADSEWSVPRFALGEVLVKMGNDEESLAEYQAAITIDPSWALPYYSMGEVHERMKEYDEALADFRNVVILDQDWPLGHFAVARVLTELENYEEAMGAILTAIEKEPDRHYFHLWAALIYDKMGNKEAAKAAFEKAKELRELSNKKED